MSDEHLEEQIRRTMEEMVAHIEPTAKRPRRRALLAVAAAVLLVIVAIGVVALRPDTTTDVSTRRTPAPTTTAAARVTTTTAAQPGCPLPQLGAGWTRASGGFETGSSPAFLPDEDVFFDPATGAAVTIQLQDGDIGAEFLDPAEPYAHDVTVDGHDALSSAEPGTSPFLRWLDSGTSVIMLGRGLTPDEMLPIANRMRKVRPGAWSTWTWELDTTTAARFSVHRTTSTTYPPSGCPRNYSFTYAGPDGAGLTVTRRGGAPEQVLLLADRIAGIFPTAQGGRYQDVASVERTETASGTTVWVVAQHDDWNDVSILPEVGDQGLELRVTGMGEAGVRRFVEQLDVLMVDSTDIPPGG